MSLSTGDEGELKSEADPCESFVRFFLRNPSDGIEPDVEDLARFSVHRDTRLGGLDGVGIADGQTMGWTACHKNVACVERGHGGREETR